MNPERAASVFRELLQTPSTELIHLPRRMGLMGNPTPPDLERARELLQALMVALESGPGPNWDRVGTAWQAMRQHHGEIPREALGDGKPAFIRDMPARPSLGDPAPGTAAHATVEQDRQRFVPQARPAPTAALAAAHPAPQAPVPNYAAPPQAQPGYPQAPQPPQAQPGYPQTPQPGYAQPPAQAAQPPAQPQQAWTPPAPSAPAAQPAAAPPARRAPPPPPQRGPAPAAAPATDDAGTIENSVAKYAAFCAACASQPQRVFAIQVEYGIQSPEGRAELEETWQDRFDDDPALQQQWERLFAQFRGQVRR